ncbi:type II toxin-antitoxin system VapC family toxin [Ferroglobus sp.]|uniref:type II toxin-antitoxin system VapC family toxin n=1 Tax=Ferroglobus sp. TaxID=2614230 RepID=UPI0025C32E18|nr:type II toxin-antitoxin system VapC family toxin [Ferroglobus sp.]
MIVLDTSVIVDSLLPKLGERYKKANELLKKVKDQRVYAPKILKVELATILGRKKSTNLVRKFVDDLTSEINLISEVDLFDTAYEIAFLVKGRAVDIYFIATAKITNSILITNDKVMARNAKKVNIEAYYLIEEFDKAVDKIKELYVREN